MSELTVITGSEARFAVPPDPSKEHAKPPGKSNEEKPRENLKNETGVGEEIQSTTTSYKGEREKELCAVVKSLTEPGKGILAADESWRQLGITLDTVGLENTGRNRRRYFELLLDDQRNLSTYLSGVILREEFVQPACVCKSRKVNDILKSAGIKLGIRADKGVVPLAGTSGEWTTAGLDDLERACHRFKAKGADFALWRCVYTVTEHTPSALALHENSNTLARFASVSQNHGLVPIVSPEVLANEDNSVEYAQRVLKSILSSLLKALSDHHVMLEGIVIRLTPAYSGKLCPEPANPKNVAQATMQAIYECVPAAVGGVIFARCSSLAQSVAVLNFMNQCPIRKPLPMTFCYSHVIQEEVIDTWAGQDRNVDRARWKLVKNARECSIASLGQIYEKNGFVFISNVTKY